MLTLDFYDWAMTSSLRAQDRIVSKTSRQWGRKWVDRHPHSARSPSGIHLQKIPMIFDDLYIQRLGQVVTGSIGIYNHRPRILRGTYITISRLNSPWAVNLALRSIAIDLYLQSLPFGSTDDSAALSCGRLRQTERVDDSRGVQRRMRSSPSFPIRHNLFRDKISSHSFQVSRYHKRSRSLAGQGCIKPSTPIKSNVDSWARCAFLDWFTF